MSKVTKIHSKNKPEEIRKTLIKIAKGRKTLVDFLGKLPNTFGDGLTYQKKVRNEW